MKALTSPLSDGRVRLRLLREADLEMVRAWRNQEGIRSAFFSSDVITAEQQREWWGTYVSADDDAFYIIEVLDAESGARPVGTVALHHYDPVARTAEYGRLMIGENWARGKGFARAASRLLLGYAFGELGLDEIHLEVLTDNEPARRLYESLGFREKGAASRSDAIRMVTARASQSPRQDSTEEAGCE